MKALTFLIHGPAIFPTLIIATASQHPVEEEDAQAKEPDPYPLGNRFGMLGVAIRCPKANAKASRPKVTYKFDPLRQVRQQMSINVCFIVKVTASR